ncbi:hypothetical protein BC832DRAFT_563362 [Gaertneriomyces semiglobifer]|nr:hypothetical protein BC832DRAFT_563362 [Gaertneriomyces semiglobifer]
MKHIHPAPRRPPPSHPTCPHGTPLLFHPPHISRHTPYYPFPTPALPICSLCQANHNLHVLCTTHRWTRVAKPAEYVPLSGQTIGERDMWEMVVRFLDGVTDRCRDECGGRKCGAECEEVDVDGWGVGDVWEWMERTRVDRHCGRFHKGTS